MNDTKQKTDQAIELCVRHFWATSGFNPEDVCEDAWQEQLRQRMWDTCEPLNIDPCEISCALLYFELPNHPLYQYWRDDAETTDQKYHVRKFVR